MAPVVPGLGGFSRVMDPVEAKYWYGTGEATPARRPDDAYSAPTFPSSDDLSHWSNRG